MLELLTLAIAQSAAPAAAPSQEAVAKEMVAINRTLDKWKGGVYKNEGKITCRMETSSGDQAVDLLRCTAMVKCYAPRVDDLDAIANADLPLEERKEQMQAVMDDVEPCIAEAHRDGVRRIATVRAAQ